LRPKTRASLVIVRYGKHLTLCARCDRHLFTLSDTRQFLALYVNQLEHMVATSLS
jgi:hypothetical protein